MRYWAGVDQRDAHLFGSAFAPDAQIALSGAPFVDIGDILRRGLDGGFAHTSHSLASQSITLGGDGTGSVTSFAVAHLVDHEGSILVRGLRYDDAVVQVGEEWRIARREHRVLWQYDVHSVVPHVP